MFKTALFKSETNNYTLCGAAFGFCFPIVASALAAFAGALPDLRAIVGEDEPELLAEFISEYLEDMPRLLADLRQSVAQGDSAVLERTAHTLKSSSATFGAMTLADLCRELEAMSHMGQMDGAAAKVVQVEAEYERVKIMLDSERSRETP